MALVLNGYGNCDLDLKGTRLGDCFLSSWGDLTGVLLLKKRTTIPLATADTAQTWTNLLKGLTIFPYNGIYNFEQNTPESETATSSTGVLTEIRVGKPQYSFSFTKGGCLHKSLWNKRGQSRWDIGLIFESGILLAASDDCDANGFLKGFDAGMFSVATLSLLSGTDPQMSTATVQFLNADEFNAQHTFITWDDLGINLSTQDGVLDLNITFPTGISDSNTIVAKVTSACNSDEVIPVLDDDANWSLVGTMDTPVTITGVTFDATTGLYTFALSGALTDGDRVKLVTKDGSYVVAVDAIGNLYKGVSCETVVGSFSL